MGGQKRENIFGSASKTAFKRGGASEKLMSVRGCFWSNSGGIGSVQELGNISRPFCSAKPQTYEVKEKRNNRKKEFASIRVEFGAKETTPADERKELFGGWKKREKVSKWPRSPGERKIVV